MPTIINCNPHETVVLNAAGDVIATFAGSNRPARIEDAAATEEPWRRLAGIPLYAPPTSEAEIRDLPPPAAGVWYIVSRVLFDACPERTDLLAPRDLVRNEAGEVLGCRSFYCRRTPTSRLMAPTSPALSGRAR